MKSVTCGLGYGNSRNPTYRTNPPKSTYPHIHPRLGGESPKNTTNTKLAGYTRHGTDCNFGDFSGGLGA